MLRILVVSAVVSAILAADAQAGTTTVIHDRYAAPTVTFTANHMCAFPVTITTNADIDDAYFFDASGTLTRLLETVQQATVDYSANGNTLGGKGSGGFDVAFAPDGTTTVRTFGINVLLTIPTYGPVILDTGTAIFLFDADPTTPPVQFVAGPSRQDTAAICSALS